MHRARIHQQITGNTIQGDDLSPLECHDQKRQSSSVRLRRRAARRDRVIGLRIHFRGRIGNF